MNHWLLLLAIPALAYRLPSLGPFSFNAAYLLVPLAALLGRRYGVTGVIAVAVGGLAYVPNFWGHWGAVGGSPALYLVALAVVAIAAIPRPVLECLHWPQGDRAAWWLTFATPWLLLLFIGTGKMESPGHGLRLSFGFDFSPLGYFLLFVLGARGVRVSALILGLAVAAALSWYLSLAGVFWRPGTPIYLSLNALQPSIALAALGAISAGVATAAFLRGDSPAAFWQRPYFAVTALVILWFGPPAIAEIPLEERAVRYIQILQSVAMLPLAGFMAGLLRGARGTIFVTVLVAAVTLVWAVVAGIIEDVMDVSFPISQIPAVAPIVAGAFALMGAKLREARNGVTSFNILRLPAFLVVLGLVVLGAAVEIMGEGGQVRTALAGLFLASVIAAFIAVWRMRRTLGITSEKWAGFMAILGVVGTVMTNLDFVGQSLKQLFVLILFPLSLFSSTAQVKLDSYFDAGMDTEWLFFMVVLAVIYLILFIAFIRGMVRVVPKIYQDLRKIAVYLRRRKK
ncbi:MAG: hypothetical protein NUV51_07490 [Sulfuricaulis sp.]|nr:hypothetical protein [Sulfuricaulis sp.]